MNLSAELRDQAAASGSTRKQLITLAVDTLPGRRVAESVRPFLLGVKNVVVVESDPASARVWVFTDGAVEPESLVEALESWGYGAYVLGNQFDVPA